jgi:iron complex outermembrane recepter protein
LDFVNPSNNGIQTVNAGKATIKGIETEIIAVPLPGLQINVNHTYLEANQDGDVINPFDGTALSDTSLPLTPRNKYDVNAEYTFTPLSIGALSTRIGYSWTDEQTSNGGPGTANDPRPSYGLLDARITLADIAVSSKSKLSASAWVKNLENKEYVIYRFLNADIYGETRSYGVDLTFRY